MPVLKFTQADKLRSLVAPDGWYTGEVTGIDGPKKSSSGKSFNYFVTIAITEGKLAQKDFTLIFNTESNRATVMGTALIFPTDYFLHLQAAITGTPLADLSVDSLDTDTLLHKPFDFKLTKGVYDGIVMNAVQEFLPKGMGQVQAQEKVPF